MGRIDRLRSILYTIFRKPQNNRAVCYEGNEKCDIQNSMSTKSDLHEEQAKAVRE